MIDRIAWDNNELLRKSVQEILREWGEWSQGGWENLSYPDHEPWTTPPERRQETRLIRSAVDVDRASLTERAISEMASDRDGEKGARLLVLRYVKRMDERKITKAYNRERKASESRSMVLGRLYEAEWWAATIINELHDKGLKNVI